MRGGILARPEGIEPPTTSLEGRCSIQLSYGRKPLTISYLYQNLCSIIHNTFHRIWVY